MPAQQALDTMRTGIAAADDLTGVVRNVLAQPVGQAVADSGAACNYLRKQAKKWATALNKVSNRTGGFVMAPLAQFTSRALDQTAALSQTVGNAALGAVPAGGGIPGPVQPGCKAPFHIISNAGNVNGANYNGTCGQLSYSYQCQGLDGQPAWSIGLEEGPPTYGAVGLGGSSNYDPHSPSQEFHAWPDGDYAACVAAAQSGFAAFAVNCRAGIVAPPQSGHWNIYYYCDPCADPNGVHNWHAQVAPSNPGNPWLLFSSAGINFKDQPTAQAALDSSGALLDAACQYADPQQACQQKPPTPPAQPAPPTPGASCPPPQEAACPPASIPEPDTPCGFSPPAFPAVLDERCARWQQFVDQVVDAGEKITYLNTGGSNEAHVKFLYVVGIMKSLFTGQVHPGGLWEALDRLNKGEIACDVLDWWTKVLVIYICPKSVSVQYALAVKAVLEMWSGMATKADWSSESSDSTNAGLGAEVFHLGSHTEQTVGTQQHQSVGIDIKLELVPLIELIDRVIRYLCPMEIPGVGDAIEAYRKGTMTTAVYECTMRMNGAEPAVFDSVLWSGRERLHDWEFIQWARRNDWTDTSISTALRDWGYLTQVESDQRVEMSYELPTISDHLHWLQRNVFDSEYVKDYNLLDGFDTDANIAALDPEYAGYQTRYPTGRNFWAAFGHDLHALGMREQYAAYHYAAHWVNLSPGQLAEMVQRLRPGRVDPSVQFTIDDFLRLLAEQDIAPFFRERLRQIAFRTLPIRQLTQLVVTRQIDAAELSQRWQDIGYKQADADILAKALMIQGERQRATQMRQYTPAVVAKLWPAGQIARADAYKVLAPQGMTQADVDTLLEVADKTLAATQYEKHTIKTIDDYARLAAKAYGDGVVSADNAIAALERAGYSADAATLEIQTIDLQRQMARADDAAKAIKRSFLRGELTATDATNAMALAGFLPGAAADYVSRWQLLLTVPRKAATRAQILKWARDGIISAASAEQRLLNLGYAPDTVRLDLLELAQTIKQAQQLAASRQAAQLARAQAAAQRALASTQKAFCKLYTPQKMELWYAERIIDESTFRSRLKQCGWNQDQINLSFEEATVKRAKRDEQAAKKGPTGIQYTGPGADTSQ